MIMKVVVTKRTGRKTLWFAPVVMTLPFLAGACAGAASRNTSTAAVAQNPCRDADVWREDLRILEPKLVVHIEPHYTRNTCDGTTQVIGTQVVLRPPSASSSAALSRMLRCVFSRVLIGELNPARPSAASLWLPDGWLDIEVKPDGGDFLVTLSAESVPKNIQLFHRTTDFLGAHAPPGGP
jgi:hypothetical protein